MLSVLFQKFFCQSSQDVKFIDFYTKIPYIRGVKNTTNFWPSLSTKIVGYVVVFDRLKSL